MTTPDPTSPAGMSKPAIKRELLDTHGWDHDKVRELLTKAACVNALIDARLIAEGRQPRDDRHRVTPVTPEPVLDVSEGKRTVAMEDIVEDEDDDDFSDLDDLLDDEAPDVDSVGTLNLDTMYGELTEEDKQINLFNELSDESEPDGAVWSDEDFAALDEDYQADIDRNAEEVAAVNAGWAAVSNPGDTDDIEDLLAEVEAAQPRPLFLGLPTTLDYIFDGHAGAGPSGAERWMNCTASLGAVREFLETLTPNQQAAQASGGLAAHQGTTAHMAGESAINLMLGNISPEEHDATLLELTLEPPVAGEAYDEEMAEYLTEYTDYVQSFIDAGHEVSVEGRVTAMVPLTVAGAYTHVYEDGDELPDWYAITGSVDLKVMPIPTHNRLTVGDLKYGNGIDVDVESNPQIRIYALAILSLMQDEEGNLPELDAIDYAIIQPRLGGIKTWTESVDDLLTWRDEVLSPALTAALGLDNNAAFNPSDLTCQWCPVRGRCPALTKQRIDAAADLFDVVVEAEFEGHDISTGLPNTTALDSDTLGKLLTQVEGLVGLKDDLKAEAQRRLHRGEEVSGYQLVNYTPARSWKEGADVALAKVPVWKPQALLTPTQALKMLGEQAHKIEKFINVPDKRPVIARVGDKRKTWEGKPPEQMFPDEVSGNETGE